MYKIWRLLVYWIWISCQKRLNFQMGVAGPFFEPHPSNLVRIHFILSCKSAEIFVVIFQLVSNLAKISVSVLSISWGVLAQCQISVCADAPFAPPPTLPLKSFYHSFCRNRILATIKWTIQRTISFNIQQNLIQSLPLSLEWVSLELTSSIV